MQLSRLQSTAVLDKISGAAGYELTSEKCIAIFATEKLYYHPIRGNYQMWV